MTSIEYFRDKFKALNHGEPSLEYGELADELALTFLDHYYYNDRFDTDLIDMLCDMSTVPEADLGAMGSGALFGIIVERLCDDFEDLQSEAYNRLMSHILSYCCALPAGAEIRRRMERFDLKGFESIYKRAEHLRATSCTPRPINEDVRKVLFLSRVTIGADVVVTSVLVQRAERVFSGAELVVLGGEKTGSLFAGHRRIRVKNVEYVRRGGLMERFESWLQVLQALDEEISGLSKCEYLVIDTDSRLSQLGVLPVVEETAYMFFNSRSSFSNDRRLSVSEMANRWFTEVTGEEGFAYPCVWPDPDLLETARNGCGTIRRAGATTLVAVNLGVGGNMRKRIGDEFECEMILELLKEPGVVVLLDKGFGPMEHAQAAGILAAAEEAGHETADINFSALDDGTVRTARVISVESGIDEAAALIAACDEYVGYDSAGQHLAAALGVTVFTIFAGSNSSRFVRRWRPFGQGRTEIIHVDTLTSQAGINIHRVIQRIMHLRKSDS